MLNQRSIERLKGVHLDLVRVVHRAAQLADSSSSPFVVTEGLRTLERQRELYARHATTTMKSRHLTGHAVDLAAVVGGQVRWDWPLYDHLADLMKDAAKFEAVPIEWGGDWKTFKDGPHFQLPWSAYP